MDEAYERTLELVREKKEQVSSTRPEVHGVRGPPRPRFRQPNRSRDDLERLTEGTSKACQRVAEPGPFLEPRRLPRWVSISVAAES